MFKKPFKVQTQNLLKSSEIRKIKEQVTSAYPSITAELWDQILPKGEKLIKLKLSGSHTLIYQETKEKGKENGEPLFIDVDGRGDFYFTVYALWRAPMIQKTVTIHPPVFKYIQGGADLMLPGVKSIENQENLIKNEKRGIILSGTILPIAVTKSIIDQQYIAKNGMSGKGFESIHYFGDSVWELGSQSQPPYQVMADGEFDNNNNNTINDETTQMTQQVSESSLSDNNNNSNSVKESKQEDNSIQTTKTEENSNNNNNDNPLRTNQDALLEYCFMYCIKYHLKKDNQFPILYNKFNADMSQLPCRPLQSTVLDMKKSSWKKVSVFMSEMKNRGLIAVQENSPGVFHVTSVNRIHPDYLAFKATGFSKEELAENEALNNNDSNNNNNNNNELPIEIVELYKPPSGLVPLFLDQGGKKGDLYTIAEAREMLSNYITSHSLTDPSDKQMVVVDPFLASNVTKSAATHVSKRDVNDLFLKKLQPYYAIHQGNSVTDVRKGSPEPILITIENRQGGKKHVTHIAGLENFTISPDYLAGEFNKLFAASSSVQQLPGKTAGKEVLVQGDVGKRVMEYVIEKYHVPKKYFTFQEKGKKSK